MNITKEEFTELAKKHLTALESYKLDEEGNTKIEIYGIEKLYEAINVTHSSITLPTMEEINIKATERAKYIAPTNATPLVSHRRSFRLGAEFVINYISENK